MVAPAPNPAPPTLQRLVGHVAAVSFRPVPSVTLEGHPQGFSAAPALIERAFALRGAPVQAFVLMPEPRLVRIDPASDTSLPDLDTATGELVGEWDELLQRLAP